MTQIHFNQPLNLSVENIGFDLKSLHKFSGDGPWTKKCHQWFKEKLGSDVLLTTSCTHALEMMALLIDVQPGDEVIMPSYTFVSTANAFALRGAKIIFVDVRPDTMNIDEKLIENAITKKTKAIVVVHYAGVGCEMKKIKEIADKHDLYLLEDAAQGMMSTYDGMPLGTIGHLGAFSFHETKNYHCGEGGLLIINDKKFLKDAEIIREKGTDRSSFLRGEVDKYTWQLLGSSYLPSELNAAFLHSQFDLVDQINEARIEIWNKYYENFKHLESKGFIELPHVPKNCEHNAHMFYVKLKSLEHRDQLMKVMKENEISVITHYVPLHSAPAGLKFGTFSGDDVFTTKESSRLLRFPMYYGLTDHDFNKIISVTNAFFAGEL